MAAKKPAPGAALGKLQTAFGGLLSRLPFLKRARPVASVEAEEPFSSILDGADHSGAAMEPNAAPAGRKAKRAAPKADPRAIARDLASNKLLLGVLLGLGSVLLLAFVTAVLVAIPPKAPPRAGVDPAGAELVGRFILPPDPLLAAEMPLAVPAGSPLDPGLLLPELEGTTARALEELRAKNDAWARGVLGAVP